MRIRDLIRIIRQRIDFIDLAAWLLLRVLERRSAGGSEAVRWLRDNPDDVREVLTALRNEMREHCKRGTLRSVIREALGR